MTRFLSRFRASAAGAILLSLAAVGSAQTAGVNASGKALGAMERSGARPPSGPGPGTALGGSGRQTLGGPGSVRFGDPGGAVAAPIPAPTPTPSSSFRALADRFDRAADPR